VAPPPTFEQAHDELREQIIHEGVQKVVQEALAGVKVVKFNADGTVPKPGDAAAPPPVDGTGDAAPQPPKP
jgi:peptidyl-prolyl cis-trans isomerase C